MAGVKGRSGSGGARPGGGRPPKEDEIKLIESMDAILAPKEAWEALAKLVKDGNVRAVQTWLGYRYGQPKQVVDMSTNGKDLNIPISIWVNPNDKT